MLPGRVDTGISPDGRRLRWRPARTCRAVRERVPLEWLNLFGRKGDMTPAARSVSLSVVVAVAAFVGARIVSADQPRVSFVDATETVCTIIVPGEQWVSGDGILHVRGQVRHDRVVPNPG